MARPTGTGIWSEVLRYGDAAAAADAAGELEGLGYSALWVPDVGGDLFGALQNLLAATTTVTVATGILSLWLHEPQAVADAAAAMTAQHGRRLLLGIGVSHAVLVDSLEPDRYRRPLERTAAYLDDLDRASPPLPPEDRALAALGPRMLGLARDRTAGAHSYLVTPEHTAGAREVLGEGPLLAPEQAVVLDTDPTAARATARRHLALYLSLPNYANNWRRWGFTDADIADGGSDRLVDALVAWGDEEAIARRVDQHRQAGADHVCVQILGGGGAPALCDRARRLAPALTE